MPGSPTAAQPVTQHYLLALKLRNQSFGLFLLFLIGDDNLDREGAYGVPILKMFNTQNQGQLPPYLELPPLPFTCTNLVPLDSSCFFTPGELTVSS